MTDDRGISNLELRVVSGSAELTIEALSRTISDCEFNCETRGP